MLETIFSESQINDFYEWSDYWVFWASLGVLAVEGVRLLIKRKLNWNIIGDSVTNFVTLYAFYAIGYLAYATFYIAGYYHVYYHWGIAQLEINAWTILACILLADIAYYWEHRVMHRTGLGWATHTVHHSSPYFNISVAYRFGPLDGILPFFFHLPLAFLGFNPLLIFLSESVVQLYQTFLHTELVKKLPRPIEAVFNTPSHHRVHHGSNRQYHDRNYAGILIIWDRMFGTFAEEDEKVVYGITNPVNSVNPFNVFFHGLYRLALAVWNTPGFVNKFRLLYAPPSSVIVEP